MNVPSHQFNVIANLFRGAIGVGLALYVMELVLVTLYGRSLLQEDGLVETVTAVLFLSGGLIALAQVSNDPQRWLSLAICALGFVGFLDELSFGQRLLGYEAIAVRGVRIDAAHDLIDLSVSVTLSKLTVTQLTALTCVTSLGLAFMVYGYRAGLKVFWGCSRVIPFIAFAFGALALAYLIDEGFENVRGLGDWAPVASLEELCEFVGAASISCAASIRALEVGVEHALPNPD